jgi:hypothetical protein
LQAKRREKAFEEIELQLSIGKVNKIPEGKFDKSVTYVHMHTNTLESIFVCSQFRKKYMEAGLLTAV